ncbi:tRNA guanosine(34) transglycosylase Tgt [Polyangium sp. rjm3]|uniref:tRNA guanosine(34) transglycosylase Tgt n=1 Tax=Polyangium mundeleinium TaxID=2995306 RepID=A0ABT5EI82_9BACT|nr:tRNA guanosine(34) transglycosylase Tgt [Polyangium mundeleinium]MDC0741523.1 tRNA guanosine(34) transglycosylase Tgt [Polyangium mundeleinium]
MSGPSTPGYAFRTLATSGAARAGVLTTPHGDVPTPTFMPVGTQGSVKTMSPDEVAATGARIVLGNTYHLWLRPGPEVVAELGGLHGFTKWPHAMLTDSGGFQAFSLAERRQTSEDGFVFRSHLDGAKKVLTPEVAMQVQGKIGADIAMQLDICPPGDASRADFEAACARTTRWARRCLAAKRPDQAVFGIVQGGTDPALRRAHAEELAAMPFAADHRAQPAPLRHARARGAGGDPRGPLRRVREGVARGARSGRGGGRARPRYLMLSSSVVGCPLRTTSTRIWFADISRA